VRKLVDWLQARLDGVLATASDEHRRPDLRADFETNLPGVYAIGDLAGAPVIKLAMGQGVDVIEHIAALPDAKASAPGMLDVLVVGAGAAGLNAALAAKERGLSCVVLEKERLANTIENFPEGKWVYAEPDAKPARGKLWLDGATKEDLVRRWHQIVRDNALDVRTGCPLTGLKQVPGGGWTATIPGGEVSARRVVIATGQRGNPRKLGVPGEEQERVYHRLYHPKGYANEDLLVVGAGNSAVEAALTLAEANRVVLVNRGEDFPRVFAENAAQLERAVAAGKIRVLARAGVKAFGDGRAVVTVDGADRELPFQHAFVLVGAELPVAFLKSLGIRLENEWHGSFPRMLALVAALLFGLWIFGGAGALNAIPPVVGGVVAAGALVGLVAAGHAGDRYAWLGISFFIWYSVYVIKMGKGSELWPYRGWGHAALSFGDRPWSFWYTVAYTLLMTVFGVKALKRWGIDRKDRFQIWRYACLIGFQWTFFFLIPEFLFQSAIEHRWVGEKLAADPVFAGQAWRSYGLVYAWPLFFYTFFYDPHWIWVVWGIVLTFVVLPILVLFHGKRYCSWICGCGGLAETFGDAWRHLAPKGANARRWERMGVWILGFAAITTALMLLKDLAALRYLSGPAKVSMGIYRVAVDVFLVGILPLTLYPFLGGKVWCRYWCPLAKLMELESRFFVGRGVSQFAIQSNPKCIGCHECTRNCQVGIDVMRFALKQEPITNANSSCIGCGICVSVCPMDTLSFGRKKEP
jgi:NosR/NirI family nitrous oxide reductase transcriptional regulator